MTSQPIEEMFKKAAQADREAMVTYAEMISVQQLQVELSEFAALPEEERDLDKFPCLIARSYAALGIDSDEKEKMIAEHLGVRTPEYIRKFITGEYVPFPQILEKICENLDHLLSIRRSSHLSEGMRATVRLRETRKPA